MPLTATQAGIPRAAGVLVPLLLLALFLRAVPALDYGRDWHGAGSFTLVNFDEGGSCRAALRAFAYTPFVGWQTTALAALVGAAPPSAGSGAGAAAKAYCHGAVHITIARLYSACAGALTVAALFFLARLLLPRRPLVAFAAAAMLATSGWHISESMVGTVDAASTFFIYAFLAAGVWAAQRGGLRWLLAAALLLPALWTKYWVFALLSAAVLVPAPWWARLPGGLSRPRIVLLAVAYAALFGLVSNPALAPTARWIVPLLFWFLVPWRCLAPPGRLLFALAPFAAPLAMTSDLFVALSSGGITGRFGTDYGAIGWHKWLRNAVNLPAVLTVGLGLPGLVLFLRGLLALPPPQRSWLVLLPLPVFALYMLFLAPVTYYRHYLPLLPVACLLAGLGIASLRPRWRVPALAGALAWQALLAVDLVSDYHHDPRRLLPALYAREQPRAVLAGFYVNPPPVAGVGHGLFRVADARGAARRLRAADLLILSENWYDTAFANELNGPLVHDPLRLIKTTPEAVAFHRRALAGGHPLLEPLARLRAPTFMPELFLHRHFYGSFTQFVGDLVVFRVRDDGLPAPAADR